MDRFIDEDDPYHPDYEEEALELVAKKGGGKVDNETATTFIIDGTSSNSGGFDRRLPS